MWKNEFAEGVLAGVCLASALLGFTQDLMGLAAWIAWEERHWINLPAWVFGIVSFIALSWVVMGMIVSGHRVWFLDERERRIKILEDKLKGKQ